MANRKTLRRKLGNHIRKVLKRAKQLGMKVNKRG